MYEPSYPSTPPPPDEPVRPMGFLAAAMWVSGAHLIFLSLVGAVLASRKGAERDLISHLICQVVAYGAVLFGMLRIHAPDGSIRDFIGWRRTAVPLIPLAAVLGAAIAVPSTWLLLQIEARFPPPPRQFDFITIFYDAGMPERVAIAVGVIAIGPFLEEVLFRGALYTPLLKARPAVATVLVSAAYFALVHHEPRRLLPIFLVGVALGFVRIVSGSIIPAVTLHMAFNAVPFVGLFTEARPAPDAPPETIAPHELLGALAVALVAVLLLRFAATRSARVLEARHQDQP